MGNRTVLLMPLLLAVALFASFHAGEVGPDQQISDLGGSNPSGQVAVAYNPVVEEYLAAWVGTEGSDIRTIYGQRLVASDGSQTGEDDFQVAFDAVPFWVDIAYGAGEDQYLIVWDGPYSSSAVGIWVVRLENDGTEVISEDEIRSDVKQSTSAHPAVAYNSDDDQYLVVWEEDVDPEPAIKTEIWGQLLNYRAIEIGDPFQISDVGGPASDRAEFPDVAYNPDDDEYLVVWQEALANEDIFSFSYRINARRVTAAGVPQDSGYEVSSPDYRSYQPAVAYNTVDGEYLVVWHSGSTIAGVFGQRLIGSTGALTGDEHFLISQPEPPLGAFNISSRHPDVVYNPADDRYLVVWDSFIDRNAQDETNIFGQLLIGATGGTVGVDHFRISSMDAEGIHPTAAYDSVLNCYLAAWTGTDDFSDYETYIQLYCSDDDDSDDEGMYFSTRTTQYGISDDVPIHLYHQNAYEIEAPGESILPFLERILPRRIGLDALDVRGGREVLFSVGPGGTIRQSTGRLRLYEGQVYSLDLVTGLIAPDPDAPTLPTLDALDATYGGYAISTDSTRFVSYPGGIKKLFHDAIYLFDPLWTGPSGSPFTLLFSGAEFHINGIDAVDVLEDGRIAFSPEAVSHVPTDDGLMRLYDPNVYIYDPADGSITLALNMGAYHVYDLDAVTLEEGMETCLTR